MSSISDVIGKLHFLTSVSLEPDISRTVGSKSKCACCGVETPSASVNFFDTYGRRLKTLFGVNFKPRADSAPVGANVQPLESLWTICDLCVKQLEVAELLFWKVFRTHDMEVLVTTLDDGRELYQLRQSGVPIEESVAENNVTGGVIMSSEEAVSEAPPAKKPRKGDSTSLSSGRRGSGEVSSFLETDDDLGSSQTTTNTTGDADTEYASLQQCDFCGNFIVEMEKGMLAEHRRNCAANPLGTRKLAAPVVEEMLPPRPLPIDEEPIQEVESISFYVCHLCNGPVKTEELLRQHYQTVHKTCPEDLSKYKTVSTNVCPWCMAPFQSAKAKKRHMTSRCVKKPGTEQANAANSGAPEAAEQQQFKCKYCSLLFPSQRSRFNHFYRAHNRYK